MCVWVLVLIIPLICGAIMCYNCLHGIPPPNGIWVLDERFGGLRYRRT
jgi:hypothetical protein